MTRRQIREQYGIYIEGNPHIDDVELSSIQAYEYEQAVRYMDHNAKNLDNQNQVADNAD